MDHDISSRGVELTFTVATCPFSTLTLAASVASEDRGLKEALGPIGGRSGRFEADRTVVQVWLAR